MVVSAFNLCKKQKQPQSWKKDEILSEFIWCKSLFKFKAKTICFENWIKYRLLYFRDLFDQNGNMHNLSYLMNILTKKHNIWYEYAMLKRAIKENITLFDFSDTHHIPNQEMRVFFKKVYKDLYIRF